MRIYVPLRWAVSMLLISAAAQISHGQVYDLTGFWQTDNNTEITHFIRQVDNEIYWYMSNPPNNFNVFHGTIVGNIITGKWIGLPGSTTLSDGTLAIRIESDNRLLKLSESGAQVYSAKSWTRNFQMNPGGSVGGTTRKDLLEEIVVSSLSSQPVASKMIFESGKNYIIEARGTFSCTTGLPACIDAAWCFAPRCTRNDPWGELMIDGVSFHTIAGATVPYNGDHVYRINYLGRGKQAIFGIYDAVVLNSYADNNGALTVRIYQAK